MNDTSQQLKEIYPDIFNPDEVYYRESNGRREPVIEKLDANGYPAPGLSGVSTPANRERFRLYRAVRELLTTQFGASADFLPELPWQLGSNCAQVENPAEGSNTGAHAEAMRVVDKTDCEHERLRMLAVMGLLQIGGYTDPSLGRQARGTAGSSDVWVEAPEGWQSYDYARALVVPEFVNAVTDAIKKFNTNRQLFRQAYLELRDQAYGTRNGHIPNERRLRSKLLASVTERLITDRVDPNNPFIIRQINNALATAVGGGGIGGGGPGGINPSARELEIPDLDGGTAYEILMDNVKAVRFIYFSAQLEEMKLHAVHDKVVEHFVTGMLPITKGDAADKLHTWIKTSTDRISEMERRALYGRVLGVAQGGTDVMPNREFSGLWTRFLATVSQKYREIGSTERDLVSFEQVHKSARDLAVNMSLHGYGWASPAATEMVDIVNGIFSVLDDPQVQRAYGVRDRWQLVDRVSNLYLGGAVNGVKYRTMAQTGQKIIEWLGSNSAVLASGSVAGLRLIERNANGYRFPTDDFKQLAEWCERWLAATGTADATVEQNTDPVDLPTQYTVPMLGQNNGSGMPRAVQDALEQVGAGSLPNLPTIPQA